MASPRRTARYERIPPDGFDTTALEIMQRILPLGQVCGAVGIAPYTFQEIHLKHQEKKNKQFCLIQNFIMVYVILRKCNTATIIKLK